MHIAMCSIHPYWGGINRNGGSLTILKSADTLRQLGHRVTVVSHTDRCAWYKHPPCERVIPKDADVCVAVSASDIRLVAKEAPRGAKRVWWMRGIEKWQMPEKDIRHQASKIKTICNAQHLVDWLGHGTLCYAGLDLDMWADEKKKRNGVGGLHNERHKTKRSDIVEKLCDIMVTGNSKQSELKGIYNACSTWLATSSLEGFHQMPAEAALCGCLVVGFDGPHSGTGDWLDDTTGHLFTSVEEAQESIANPDFTRVKKAQQVLREKIGNRTTNMRKFVKILGEA